ncbi:MAG: TIGR00730 family Rossman fold protein [Bacteroidales bacterium]|jgi:uncharacterized protein (TIGR00730 family)
MARVSVFCGSHAGGDPGFAEQAQALGKYLAGKQIELVYGGTHVGLMGILANSVLAHGGSVEGVIPDLIEEMQLAYRGLTRMVKVPDLESRKKYLIEHADLLLALPGGYGTIDEFFTAAVSNQLGIIDKPLILFNVQNFYNPLIEQLDRMTALGFIKKEFRERVKVITRCDELDTYFL